MKNSRRKINKEQNGHLDVNVIDDWLKDNGDPAIERLVKKNLAIANKIALLLESKGMKPADLALAMDKQRSEISKWLSGQHTFTTKTITKIEEVLGEDIIHIEPKVRNVYFTTFVRVEDIKPVIQEDIFEDSLYEEFSA